MAGQVKPHEVDWDDEPTIEEDYVVFTGTTEDGEDVQLKYVESHIEDTEGNIRYKGEGYPLEHRSA